MVPEITVDMMDRGKILSDTAAGQEVVSEVEKAKQYYENKLEEIRQSIQEIVESRNKEDEEELENLRETMEAFEENKKLQDEALLKMRVDSEKLRQEMDVQYAAENAILMEELRANEELLKQEMELLKEEGHKRELALQAAELQNGYLKGALLRACCVM